MLVKGMPDLRTTMRAIVRSRYGSPDVLELAHLPKPVAEGDRALVRVLAASVNAGDLDYLYGRPRAARIGTGLGRPRNRGLGLDVAGVVEAIGSAVTTLHPGDEVFGDMTAYGFGGFAEYVCASERAFAPKPVSLTFDEASTVPQGAILALQGLRSGGPIRPGDKVLINGAAGSVGPFAVQIAKSLGAEVTGVDSQAKLDMLRSLGADCVIDYSREDFTKSGHRYDRILDIVGRHSIFDCCRALSRDGTYVMLGGATRRVLQVLFVGPLIGVTRRKKMGMLGIRWRWQPFSKQDVLVLSELIGTGKLTPIIDRRYPLDEVQEALRFLEAGRARGKLVITVTE